MANPIRLLPRRDAGPIYRSRDDAPDETGAGVAGEDTSVDEGYDPPETYDDYGDWREDYADAVGISYWREL